MGRRIRKVDANQGEIVDALRRTGYSVEIISDVGRGVPDLLVGRDGYNMLIEVKSGDAGLTDDEQARASAWRGQYSVVRSPEHAILAASAHGQPKEIVVIGLGAPENYNAAVLDVTVKRQAAEIERLTAENKRLLRVIQTIKEIADAESEE